MIALLALILAVVISLLWYLPGIRAQGENRVLRRKDYFRVALVYGFAFTCLLIIFTEIVWDSLVDRTALSGLPKDIVADFFRAALLEEFFKFRGFKLAKNKLGLRRKIDYMMIAGLIGLVYGIVEKAVHGSIGGVVIGLAIPMHIVWQFNQGGHYHEYEALKAAGDPASARKAWMMAVPATFLFHGCWDSGLDIAFFCLDREALAVQLTGGALLLAMIAFGVVYSVKTVRKVQRTARAEA